MPSNSPQEPASAPSGARGSAADPLGRQLMTYRDYLAWLLCGLAWHAAVTLLVRGDLGEFLPGVAAGMLAGCVAGALTVWSRRRRAGREHWGDLCTTYLAAVLVYSTSLAFTEMFVNGWMRAARLGPFDLDLLVLYLLYGMLYAAVWAVVLVPLSYLTRRVVWRVHVRDMLPNKA